MNSFNIRFLTFLVMVISSYLGLMFFGYTVNGSVHIISMITAGVIAAFSILAYLFFDWLFKKTTFFDKREWLMPVFGFLLSIPLALFVFFIGTFILLSFYQGPWL
ncbi:MAG: hypothetical protein AAF228_06060 [Pseudomonadota bacterium]